MSYNQLQYAAYTAAQQNTSKCKQVVMLYDGAMRFITKAMDAIKENNIQERFNNLERASKIILGLQSALDFDRGGEVAKVLDEYYHNIDMRLVSVHYNNDASICEKVLRELKIMREAWEEVDMVTAKQDVSSEKIAQAAADAATNADSLKGGSGAISVDI